MTQEQIELALKRGSAGAGDREVQLSEILLPVYDRDQEGAVLDDAQGLVAALRGGANFAALARQVSAAASAENGGDLGWVPVSAIMSRTCATGSRRCRSGRSPSRSSARPACTSSWFATSATAPTGVAGRPRVGPAQHRAGAARAAGQPLPARPAPGGVHRRPASDPRPAEPAAAPRGLRADKRLGQHFLFDPSILRRIAAAAGDLAGRPCWRWGPAQAG